MLRTIRDAGPLARTEIAEQTGLAAGAVTSLVANLSDLGLVRATGTRPNPGVAGRPRSPVEFDGTTAAVVGAHVDVRSVTVLAADLGGRELYRRTVEHAAGPGDHAAVVACLGAEIGAASGAARQAGARPVAVALAIAGVVVTGSGVVSLAPILQWRDVPLAGLVRDELRGLDAEAAALPILLDNDANLSALAEHRALPAAVARQDVVVVSGYVGVGAGVIVDGRIFRGAGGGAGEAGHLSVDSGGTLCWCGRRGCLEAVGAPPVLLAEAGIDPAGPSVRPAADGDPADALALAVAELVRSAQRRDPRTLRVLDTLAGQLADTAVILTTVLGSETVLLGGHYAALAPWLLPRVREALAELRGVGVYRNVEARGGLLGAAAPVWGAAALATDLVLDDPASAGPAESDPA
ncbi:ROK family protein [Yinghuangia soli]|uniref:ROK family protein n=1 Tax=Yinghuangia soli TaxID=2908204 RepID=A0AA41Q7D9_9ACTN|nr:ROK family protein [Yinghuangia soli]MCF2532071.1 ROK family protein [Yinghuangia soli]